MDAHAENGREHQRDVLQQQAGTADRHDQDFRRLDDADQASLVVIVRKLSGERRQQEEGQDEKPLGDRTELRFPRRIRIKLVGDEQDDALLEQAVVEGPEELRGE